MADNMDSSNSFLALARHVVSLENKILEYESSHNSKSKKTKKSTKSKHTSWMVVPEYMGYATARLILGLNALVGRDICDELESVRLVGDAYVINEIDREKVVRSYCIGHNLVDRYTNSVYLDDLLRNILIDDAQISHIMESTNNTHGTVIWYIPLDGNAYVKKISCAIRRLDNL